jgi:hypothetical protein
MMNKSKRILHSSSVLLFALVAAATLVTISTIAPEKAFAPNKFENPGVEHRECMEGSIAFGSSPDQAAQICRFPHP